MKPDVAIIGGGIIGCSIAWRLAQERLRVHVYDSGRIGGEASWAGAGMLAPGGEVAGESPWSAKSVESARIYPAFIDELRREARAFIDYRPCGALDVCYGEPELAAATARAADQRRLGIESEVLDAAETLASVPPLNGADLAGAVAYPGDAAVDPRAIVGALRVAGETLGVGFHEGVRINAADGIAAGAVVVAAGAWVSQLCDKGPQSFPVKGHLVGYNLAPGRIDPIVRRGHTYIFQRSSGFTIAGATTERAGFDKRVDASLVQSIHERAHALLPSLLISSPDESWTGLRPGVEGDRPCVGRVPETNVWLAYGHYRNGILLAPVTARIIADDIVRS